MSKLSLQMQSKSRDAVCQTEIAEYYTDIANIMHLQLMLGTKLDLCVLLFLVKYFKCLQKFHATRFHNEEIRFKIGFAIAYYFLG